jgi:hypoxanthine-guanine phosphoribosyltransferase
MRKGVKQVYRVKSEKMTGDGNHNYSKKFTEATKKKMSNSIRDAKGGVSDETIIKVRDLIKEGQTIVKIQELLNLPKHTVSRIKNGEIICRNEEKKEKQPLTQEEINLSKRKILTD